MASRPVAVYRRLLRSINKGTSQPVTALGRLAMLRSRLWGRAQALSRLVTAAFRNDDEMLSKAGQEVRLRYQVQRPVC